MQLTSILLVLVVAVMAAHAHYYMARPGRGFYNNMYGRQQMYGGGMGGYYGGGQGYYEDMYELDHPRGMGSY